MKSTQINSFLSLFYKELSSTLDTEYAQKRDISPIELAELTSAATQEILNSYLSGHLEISEPSPEEHDEYRFLALNSINSYSQSNAIFEKITDEHALILSEHKATNSINFELLNQKFEDIQKHLADEVDRANAIIGDLQNQIHLLELTANFDPLTKTFNRNALQTHFDQILSKERNTQELFVIMLDVDNFKSINDRFGHIAGDKILIFIAKLLKKALRDGDKVYRYGGDEFLILLNRTELAGAQLVADRLLNLCRNNRPLFQNEQITLTISLGLTKVRDDDTTETLINRADAAFYRAKNNGKDKVEIEL